MPEEPVIAIDPGREKCGLAAVATDGTVIARAIIPTSEIGPAAAALAAEHRAAAIILGERTGAREVRAAVEACAPAVPVHEVDEHMTTLMARRRYWRENPPRGLWRLVPEGLRVPPEPIDDWAAVILAERHLGLAAGRLPKAMPEPPANSGDAQHSTDEEN